MCKTDEFFKVIPRVQRRQKVENDMQLREQVER
jgi:hypothetical protein